MADSKERGIRGRLRRRHADPSGQGAGRDDARSAGAPAEPLTEQAGSSEPALEAARPSATHRGEQWLPSDLRHEENPLTTGAWLPARHPEPSPSEAESQPSDAEGRSKIGAPFPRSSWLPPELEHPPSEVDAGEPEPGPSPWTVTAEQAHTIQPTDQPAADQERKDHGPASQGSAPRSFWLPPELEPRQAPGRRPQRRLERPAAPDDSASFGRRTKALQAYCRELFPADLAAATAAEILDSLTGAIEDDGVLLHTTRVAAADKLTGRSQWEPAPHGSSECAETPALLAARANDTINDQDHAKLERHLASCLVCRAAEVRAGRADRAFAGILGLRLTHADS